MHLSLIDALFLYKKILIMKQGNETIYYRYGLNKVIGFNYNNGSSSKEYIYQRNIQGDIISIYDDKGNEVGAIGGFITGIALDVGAVTGGVFGFVFAGIVGALGGFGGDVLGQLWVDGESMKKRIFTTLGYMSIFIVGLIIVIGGEIFVAIISIPVFTIPRPDSMWACILMNIICIINIVIILYCNIQFFQWVEIDEKGITARNIVKKIHYKEWEEIKEIQEVWLPMSVRGGFTLKYFILIDERNDTITRNGVMRKNTYIIIPSNKKTEPIIKEYYKKEIKKLEEDS